jgi:steroid 5-alpha reductase family enzyme
VLLVAQSEPRAISLTGIDAIAILLWAIGFYFEAVGDWQLARFRANPAHRGKVMDRGLWRYTRHPNYFGDALVWWAFFLFAVQIPGGVYFVFAPLLMNFLLLRISGAALLESSLKERRPEYVEYIRKTPAFFPWFPKT